MRNITNGINAILKINRLAEMQACFFKKNLKNSQILLTIFKWRNMYIEGQSVILRFALPRDTFLVDLLKYIVFAPLFLRHGIMQGAGEDLADMAFVW